jgi:hypothetical protein
MLELSCDGSSIVGVALLSEPIDCGRGNGGAGSDGHLKPEGADDGPGKTLSIDEVAIGGGRCFGLSCGNGAVCGIRGSVLDVFVV